MAKLLSKQLSRAEDIEETPPTDRQADRQTGIIHSILRKIDKPLSEAYAVSIGNQHR